MSFLRLFATFEEVFCTFFVWRPWLNSPGKAEKRVSIILASSEYSIIRVFTNSLSNSFGGRIGSYIETSTKRFSTFRFFINRTHLGHLANWLKYFRFWINYLNWMFQKTTHLEKYTLSFLTKVYVWNELPDLKLTNNPTAFRTVIKSHFSQHFWRC